MSRTDLRLSPRDFVLLKSLYCFPWLMDWHLAVILDERVSYVTGRMLQFEKRGLIERKKLISDEEVLNYIKVDGCRLIGYEEKKKKVPKIGRFEHDKGVIEASLWFMINKKASLRSFVTEKMLNSAVEMKRVGGQLRREVKEAHLPDGYVRAKSGKYVAIEFERTKKSKSSKTQMLNNVQANSRRFVKQFWFVELDSIEKSLNETTEFKNKKLEIIRMSKVRKDLAEYLNTLPKQTRLRDKLSDRTLFNEPDFPIRSVASLDLIVRNKAIFD